MIIMTQIVLRRENSQNSIEMYEPSYIKGNANMVNFKTETNYITKIDDKLTKLSTIKSKTCNNTTINKISTFLYQKHIPHCH